MPLPLWLFDPSFWLCILLPPAAIYLLVRGWRGRVEGNEPRCRRCDYNLTGLASDRCPECGGPFDAASVRHGCRHRSAVALVVGLACAVASLVVAGTFLRGQIGRINWQNYRSFEAVLADAMAGGIDQKNELDRRLRWRELDPGELDRLYETALEMTFKAPTADARYWGGLLRKLAATRSENEEETAALVELALWHVGRSPYLPTKSPESLAILHDKLNAGKLKPAHLRTLAERLLSTIEYRGRFRYPPDSDVLAWLSKLAAAGALGEDQLRAFFEGIVSEPSLDVRARITSGECMRVALFHPAPTDGLPYTRCDLVWRRLAIGGRPIDLPRPASLPARWRDHGVDDCFALPPLSPGMHEVRCEIRYACSQTLPLASSPLTFESTIDLVAHAMTEVLPPESPDLTIVNDTSLTDVFQRAFLVRREPEREGRIMACVVCEWSTSLPVSTVFDAIVRVGDREEVQGRVACQKGQRGSDAICFQRSLLTDSTTGSAVIIFRGNPEAARETTDFTECWTGELQFGPFKFDDRP